MDALMQPGGPSPKGNSVLMSTSQLKPGLDNLQNNATSTPSQAKGKKRERGDQCSDPVKRERSSKIDDGDSGSVKIENMLRSEAAKLTEKGSLVGSESVEKLVDFIQPNRTDKKLDLVSRSMVAGVIAATDRFDCLSHFVHLKGLSVLDEWLQDVHKGRIGEVSGLKDGEKPVEEFLLVLLRALDKLPVNLHALQHCNIGRSVNRLRSHRNSDIQRKARNLVDIWKKRVEAEMNVIDGKSGPSQVAAWSSKSNLPEVHAGRNSVGSYDVSLQSSVTQDSESKTTLNKASIEETATKSICSSSGIVKASTLSPSEKEAQPRTDPYSGSDVPLSGRDDKNNSSALSNNSSHSFPGQEETRVTTTGLTNANKFLSGSSRHRRSTNGFLGTLGSQRETLGKNASTSRNAADEKLQPSTPSGEKTFEAPVVETSNHKLIVKIPNRIDPDRGSPAQSASGVSFDDPSVMNSRGSSPALSNIRESDQSLKEKSDFYKKNNIAADGNVEPLHDNDHKDLQIESNDRGEVSAAPDEAQSKNVDGNKKTSEKSKAPCSSLGDLKAKQLSSSSALNTLIESCVKYSESNAPTSAGDDVGMNLLASVAAREMCASGVLSPADSMHGNTVQDDENCLGDDSKSKASSRDDHTTDRCLVGSESEKQIFSAAVLGSKEGNPLSKQSSVESCGDKKSLSALSEESMKGSADCTEMDEKTDLIIVSKGILPNVKEAKPSEEQEICDASLLVDVPCVKATGIGSSLNEVKRIDVFPNAGNIKKQVEITSASLSADAYYKTDIDATSNSDTRMEAEPTDGEPVGSCVSSKEGNKEHMIGEAYEKCGNGGYNKSGEQILDCVSRGTTAAEEYSWEGVSSAADQWKSKRVKVNAKSEVVTGSRSTISYLENESPAVPFQNINDRGKLKRPKLCVTEKDRMEVTTSTVADGASLSALGQLHIVARVDFDLNEGFSGHDGKCGELGYSGSLANLIDVRPLPTPVSLGCSNTPSAITVAAAAKGSFVPPVDLLRNKGELGWKGSATTSAFRPVEPRKFTQMTVAHSNVSISDDCTSKPCRVPLDIDLNVADERLMEDMGCQDSSTDVHSKSDYVKNHDTFRNGVNGPLPVAHSGGFDLDLNRVDDTNLMLQYPTSSSYKLSVPVLPVKSFLSNSLSTSEVKRDFDLNSGPGLDDVVGEQSSLPQLCVGGTHSMNSLSPVFSIRPNSFEARNFSAWLPPGNSYSLVAIPSVLPDRGEHPFSVVAPIAPQRILGPSAAGPFTPDMYRGSLLSPTSAVPFPSGSFPYQMFPFGTNLPLHSGNFSVGSAASGGRLFDPSLNSQFLAPVSEVSSQYSKKYMLGLHEGSDNGGLENNRKWGRQSFDLNAGPGAPEVEGREDFLAQRQLYISGSQAIAEEQSRIYSTADGVLRRKEPEAALDRESFRYKQSSWQ